MLKLKRHINLQQNKALRVLLYPAIRLQRTIILKQYQNSEDPEYIKSLKDIHKGERCFIIGNGPSLTSEDLDTLAAKGEVCFGSNRIYKIFPRTNWRPTYYICMDKYVAMQEIEAIRKMGPFPKFLTYLIHGLERETGDDIHYICPSSEFGIDPSRLYSDTLSEDLSKYNAQSPTVTVCAIELAIYMGFTEIYLLGVDNNYAYKMRPDGTIYVDPTVKQVYFAGGEPSKTDPSVQAVEKTLASYQVAKKFSEAHGVKVFNATRGGKLEVFERVDFDKLMGQTKEKI